MSRIATNTAVLAAVLVLGFAGTADAAESLPARAVSALGVAIAAQGDAALLQIRREIRATAIDAVKPFLPDVQKAVEQQPPAATPVVRR